MEKFDINIYFILYNMRDSIYCYSKYLLSYAPKHHLCKTLVLQNSRTEISISSPIFYSIVPLLCYLLVSIIRKLSGYKARFQLSSSYPFLYRRVRVQKPWSWSELGSVFLSPRKKGTSKEKKGRYFANISGKRRFNIATHENSWDWCEERGWRGRWKMAKR